MLARLEELAAMKRSFAFETTLASRSFRPWLLAQVQRGFRIRLVFLWLPTVEIALARVQDRVRRGGHDVPSDVVRRPYRRGL
jgi:predicted ABC-type ATPase